MSAARVVTLRYRFNGGMFVNEAGEQLHEAMVPDVTGAVVWFAYDVDPLSESVAAAKEAANEIVRWLVEDCGAASAGFVS